MPSGVYDRKKKLSHEERKANEKLSKKKYNEKPENKAKRKKYDQKPEVKAKAKTRQQKPEVKAKAKAYRERPEVKSKNREVAKKYEKTPKRKAQKAAQARKPKAKARRQERDTRLRLEVLLAYSKSLSNSNVPCCACCGMSGHVDFLALDHIAGREEMDSEPELVKLGYSSKTKYAKLINWLIENNFPEGFQILCHACNYAKFNSKINTCPHETARKEEAFAMMEEQSNFEV